jgi:hypothetical protein
MLSRPRWRGARFVCCDDDCVADVIGQLRFLSRNRVIALFPTSLLANPRDVMSSIRSMLLHGDVLHERY